MAVFSRGLFWIAAAFLLTAAPVPAAAADMHCSEPEAAQGTMMFNADHRVMQYCNAGQWQAMGDKIYYRPHAYYFDGVNFDLGSISGFGAGKKMTVSLWFRRIYDFGITQYMFSDTGPRFAVFFDTANKLNIQGGSTNANNRLAWKSTSAIADTDWHHLLFSFDLATAGSMQVYIDDVQDTATPTTFSGSANISFNTANNWLGTKDGSASYFNGNLSELWMGETYLDLSVTANRRLFTDADGKPLELEEGDLYWQGDDDDWLDMWEWTYHTSGPAPSPGDLCPTRGQFLWKAWGTMGTGSNGGQGAHSFASGNYIVMESDTNNASTRLQAFTWDGTTLTKKSSYSYGGYPKYIWGDGAYFYVVGEDSGGGIDAYAFNGTTLSYKATFNTGGNGNAVWGDGTYIYMTDDNSEKLYALTFNGTSFTKKGEITLANYDVPHAGGISGDGHYIYVANYGGVEAYTFNGANFTELAAMDASDWAYIDDFVSITTANGYIFGTDSDGVFFALTFDGTDLHRASAAPPEYVVTHIFADQNYVYVSDFNGALDIFSGFTPCTSNCASPTENAGTMLYNSTYHVAQYCDGKTWQAMGPVPGNGGAGCGGDAEGTMFYDADAGVMKYCDGAGWQPVGTVTGALAAGPPASGLIHHYTFDETSGGTAHDSVGTRDGTLHGTASWQSAGGRIGGALALNGSTNYISVADGADLRISGPSSALTITAWVKPDDADDGAWRSVFSKCRNSGEYYGAWKSDDPVWDFDEDYSAGDLWLDTDYWVDDDEWQHVALVITSTSLTGYVNGRSQGTTTGPTGTAGTCTAALILGGTDMGSEYFHGLIDDVRIYNRVLSAQEIAALAGYY